MEVVEFADILLTLVGDEGTPDPAPPSCSGIPSAAAGFLPITSVRRDQRHRGVFGSVRRHTTCAMCVCADVIDETF